MILAEIRRLFAAILLAGACVILAALVAGCESSVRAEIVTKSGERIACPSGVFWITDQDTILCRIAVRDVSAASGFVVRGVPTAEADYIDVRP